MIAARQPKWGDPDFDETKLPISIYRDVASDMSGEYYPIDAWSGTRLLSLSEDYGMRVELVVQIGARARKPHHFSSHIHLRNYAHTRVELFGLKGPCSSVREVEAKVDDFVATQRTWVDVAIRDAVRIFHEPRRATCLYRITGRRWTESGPMQLVPDTERELVPVCTTFDPFLILENLPSGEYLGVSITENHIRPRRYQLYFARYTKDGVTRTAGSGRGVWAGKLDPNLYWLLDGTVA